jgi:hypothetical protein
MLTYTKARKEYCEKLSPETIENVEVLNSN